MSAKASEHSIVNSLVEIQNLLLNDFSNIFEYMCNKIFAYLPFTDI